MDDRPRNTTAAASPAYWPRRLWAAVLLWTLFYLIIVGGVGAMLVGQAFKDARIRSDLAQRGTTVSGIISSPGSPTFKTHRVGCGKGEASVVRFATRAGKVYTGCVGYDALPREYHRFANRLSPPSEGRVGVVHNPEHPYIFRVASNGVVPQRITRGAWHQLAWQVVGIMIMLVPVTSFFLYRQRRGKAQSS